MRFLLLIVLLTSFTSSQDVWNFSENTSFSIFHQYDIVGKYILLSKNGTDPDNSIGKLSTFENENYYKLGLKFRNSFCKINAKAINETHFNWLKKDGDYNLTKNTSLDLSEWAIEIFDPAQFFCVGYGKQVKLWGPSLFISPSNPFFYDNGQSNPFLEQKGSEFGFLRINTNLITTEVLINTNNRNANKIYSQFRQSVAIRTQFSTDRASGGIISSIRSSSKKWSNLDFRDDATSLGVYAQFTLNDAILLYTDIGVRNHLPGFYPKYIDSLSVWSFDATYLNSSKYFGNGVLGFSYTFPFGATVNLEYYRNQEGYNKQQNTKLKKIIDDAGKLIQSPDDMMQSYGGFLYSQLNDLKLRTRSKNYIFCQYSQRELFDGFSVVLRSTVNIVDGSFQVNPIITYYATKKIRFELVNPVEFGSKNSEYGSWVRSITFLGTRFYL